MEIFKWLFKIEYGHGIGGKCNCVQFIAIKKILKLLDPCVIPFGLGKEKTENFSYHLRAIFSFQSIGPSPT